MTVLAAASYLAAKPSGAVLVMLIVALVLFAVAGVAAWMAKAFYAVLVAAGLVALVLAFLVH